ncbi:MAG: transglutaminase family protein [Promethearchaeota archaeon]
MKDNRIFLLLYLFFFPLANLIGVSFLKSSNTIITYPQLSTPIDGVSNYIIMSNVSYEVVVNFTLTHKSGDGRYFFKFARLNSRMPNSPLTPYCPPYQESELKLNNISGNIPSQTIIGQIDRFNNTYDTFNASLFVDERVTFYQTYDITINAITFEDIDNSEIGIYDTSDEIFALYCNYSEPYYEINNPTLISQSNNIVNPGDNPVEKAEKICDWVSNYLKYNGKMPDQEIGALAAYNQEQGDCSEFSSLMITLLRIQGIPARKVSGFLISNDISTRPKVGDTWEFNAKGTELNVLSNFLGHAWVEFYVEGIGWIACDPTWNQKAEYFAKSDYLRFSLNVGSNFFFPPLGTFSEFGNPIYGWHPTNTFDSNYNLQIRVVESNLTPVEPFPIFVVIFIVIGIGVILLPIAIILLLRRGSKK